MILMKHKFYKDNIVKKARELRKKGISAAKIAKHFNATDTTIIRWCEDIPSNNSYHLYAQRLRNKAREKSAGIVKVMKLTIGNAKILASILYWCEGSKYPSSNFVAFSNSDAGLMATFLKFFRLGFRPKENKLKVSLQLHTTHDKDKMTVFWSKILDIPQSQFHKPTITKPTKNMKRRNYMGTCTIRYYDIYLLLEIIGIFEEFSKRFKN